MRTRRDFVARLGTAMACLVAGRVAPLTGQGLDQFGSSAPPCAPDARLTPAVPRDNTYREGAPLRTSLLEAGVNGTPLTLQGTVSGTTCGRIKGAELHFWHADPQGRYDAVGSRFRGRQLTDADGRYRLTTIVPGATSGRAPHIGVRVRIPGKSDFWTAIFFPNQPLNARDPRFRPELLMIGRPDGGTFDITLNL
ncbi:MAG: hypothetical protein IT184_01685 [Acidobacteria bacterium]|nr:hypothetical protein [Acidobacteriota bacterium]